MILNYQEINEVLKNGNVVVKNYDENKIQAATIDLRVGKQAITASSEAIIDLEKQGFFEIKPGEFAMVTIYEEVKFNEHYLARFGLVSSLARQGIVAAIGPQIDPGYYGALKISLINLSPQKITITYLQDIISLEIHKLAIPTTNPYAGKYNGETSLTADDIRIVRMGTGVNLSTLADDVRHLAQNVNQLTTNVNTFSKDISTLTAGYGEMEKDIQEVKHELSGFKELKAETAIINMNVSNIQKQINQARYYFFVGIVLLGMFPDLKQWVINTFNQIFGLN